MNKIILDVYGADAGTGPILLGAADTLKAHEDLTLTIVGNEDEIRKVFQAEGMSTDRVTILHTTDYLTNHDPATSVLSGRENASLVLALQALKEDSDAIGLLTAGSTGATLVGSIFRLGLQPGLKTPALAALIPQAVGGYVCLVDCGANVDCTVKDLKNFAQLGSDFFRRMYGVAEPRVALLSVGREESKGNPLTLEAHKALQEAPIHFIGNAEGCDVTTGYADVLVADGFSGNIVLKNIEATGKIALAVVQQQAKASGRENDPDFKAVIDKLYNLYELNKRGGATFLGTKKPIIKMHGVATRETVLACAEQLLQVSRNA